MRPSALLPMACAIVSFILGMLLLFAGHKPGFLETWDIVTLNTSTLGHSLIPTTTTSSGATPTSLGSFFSSVAENITASVEGELEDIANDVLGDVADKLAAELGIHQFYSLHLMDLCEGQYKPNATAKGASKNVTYCTNQTAMFHFDIADQIQQELEQGPLGLDLSDIDFASDIQDGINALNVAMDATFVLYAIGIAAAGFAILTTLVALFLHGSRLVSFLNWGVATISFVALLISSIIITIIQKKFTHIINKFGNEIGIYAYRGTKYLTITWIATALMGVASFAWVVEFCIGRRNKTRDFNEKGTGAGRSGWRHRHSDEATLRRSGV